MIFMKPKLLKIFGVNNFQSEQTIDFSSLIKDGIFGIFGDTGSGKSTIIDCITISLYGEVVRYKSNNKDFINLNCNNAFVEFVFSIKSQEGYVDYSVFREFKRNKDGNVEISKVRLINLNSDTILADKVRDVNKQIINIIGIEYKDFIKAVILPQGKFSEFLLLENSSKREMLERIFGLELYGTKLNEKINYEKRQQQQIVDSINSSIQSFGFFDDDYITKKSNLLYTEKLNLSSIEENLKICFDEKSILTNIKKLKNDYILNCSYIENLKNQHPNIAQQKLQLDKMIKASLFSPFIFEIEQLKVDLQNYLEKQKQSLFEQSSIKKSFDHINFNYEKFSTLFRNDLPILQNLKNNIQSFIYYFDENIIITEKLKSAENDYNSNFNKLKNFEKLSVDFNKKIDNINSEIEFIKNSKKYFDLSFKSSIEKGVFLLKDLENYQLALNTNLAKINQLNIYIHLFNISYKKISLEISSIKSKLFNFSQFIINHLNNQNFYIDNEILSIKNYIKNKKNYIVELDYKIKLAENKEFIAELIDSLQEGKPCPVCGSLEHPNINNLVLTSFSKTFLDEKTTILKKLDDLQFKITNLEKDKIANQQFIDFLHSNINENFSDEYTFKNFNSHFPLLDFKQFSDYLTVYLNRIKLLNKNDPLFKIKTFKEEINSLNNSNLHIINKITSLKNDIYNISKNVSLDYNLFNSTLQDISLIEKENFEKDEKIKYLELQLSNFNQTLNKNNLQKQALENKINNIKLEIVSLQTNLKAINDNMIKHSYIQQFESYFSENTHISEHKTNLITVVDKIEFITNNEKIYSEKFKNINSKMSDISLLIEKISSNIEFTKKQLTQKTAELNSKLELENISINDVLENICDELNINKLKLLIKNYDDNITKFNNNLDNISIEFFNIYNDSVDNISIDYIQNKLNLLDSNINLLQNLKTEKIASITTISNELEHIKNSLKSIESFKDELKKQQKRLDLLEELSNLNKGGLFVEYIAKKHLQYIIFDANKRLQFMTQNKYSLTLVDNNFKVRDNFNGGLLRSVRSLSGGEIFMTSLSLALALSSKIYLKNKAPLEVFFLDEGFGTLDTYLLDTVINSLEMLKNENISVGIITHIPEIKSRILNKITIKNSIIY